VRERESESESEREKERESHVHGCHGLINVVGTRRSYGI
jgi:hypothetical protein